MIVHSGARYGGFRFFVLSRCVRPEDVWLDGICDAGSLGISLEDEKFIRRAIDGESTKPIAVLGKNRAPLFVLVGMYPSAGALAAFACDLELRDFCEAEYLFETVDASPGFIRTLRKDGGRATSRENAINASYVVDRMRELASFVRVNVEFWPYVNDASMDCIRFAKTVAELYGCFLDAAFVYPAGIPVKIFDRGVFAAFIIGALNCIASGPSPDVRTELEFYFDEEKQFFSRVATEGRFDEIFFRVAADAAVRARVQFSQNDWLAVISPTRVERALDGVKVKFRITEASNVMKPPPLPDFLI